MSSMLAMRSWWRGNLLLLPPPLVTPPPPLLPVVEVEIVVDIVAMVAIEATVDS